MKKLILITFVTLIIGFQQSYAEVVVEPQLVVGLRGGEESLNDNAVTYAGAKISFLKFEVADFKQINIGAVGINYQTDGKLAASISPVSVTSLSGLTLGVDYFFKEDDVDGGNLGIFVGFTFK